MGFWSRPGATTTLWEICGTHASDRATEKKTYLAVTGCVNSVTIRSTITKVVRAASFGVELSVVLEQWEIK